MTNERWKIYPERDEVSDELKNLAKQIEDDGGCRFSNLPRTVW
ncbi:hypothetical protein [Candidatus Kryptonium thompsonii]|nr:hypothetical protein [Candidatus Kryptonium thompsoni]CUS77446.1 hypothetical protein JGI12_00118 [Candidatus Kryptonium thompsoni]CUT04188.1 hypothetical protein JGI5_01795 [Candidatus Kryptonium thompsoni]